MAGIWQLPIVFLCENNFYSMSTPTPEGTPNPDIAGKAAGYAMPGIRIDGNDLLAVRETVGEFVKRARSGKGPALIEMMTYRFSGHSRGDQRVYRTREEEAKWKKKEPIRRFRSNLLTEGILTREEDKELKKRTKQQVREAEKFARSSPWPDPATLMEGVYS